jgi:hypothetical protein
MNFTQRTPRWTGWIAAAGLALSACATAPPPEYTKDHPANPEAPSSVQQPAPGVLASYRSFSPANKRQPSDRTAPPSEQPTEESGHEQHH